MKPSFLFFGCLLLQALRPGTAQAQITYVPAAVTGYTADVIANGAGPVSSSTTATVDRGNAAVQWCFADSSFVNPSGQRPIKALPRNGFFRSISTPGLTYQMGPSAGNNSLRIDGAASGTLTLTNPQPCSEVEILATEGNGNTDPKTFTVTFTDGTTQVFPNVVVPDWYGGTITPAIVVGSRVNRGTTPADGIEDPGTDPRIYEVKLTLNLANYSKRVQSVSAAKTSTDPVLNIMGISLGSDCVGVPTPGTATASPATVCPALPVSLSLTGATVSGSITYQWQVSFDSGATFNSIPGATTNPYLVRPTANAQYRAIVTCRLQSATSAPVAVTVLPAMAVVAYAATPGPTTLCPLGTAAVVTATPAGGRFSASGGPTGLRLDPATGTVDLANSTPGTYTVTYTVALPCAASGTTTLVVAAPALVRVAYGTPARYCPVGTVAVGTATPAGGTFSSTAGLVVDASTGTVNLGASRPGSYVVTYAVTTPCPASATTSLVVAPAGVASVAYAAPGTFCPVGTAAVVAATPAGGRYSSRAGLVINATTGTVDLAASVPGTYRVVYAVALPCPATDTTTIAVAAPGVAVVRYAAPGDTARFCQAGTAAVLAATPAGGRFSAPAGLALDAATGSLNLATSAVGTYVVTYAVAVPCAATGTAVVKVTPPAATFTYACPPFYQNGASPAPTLTGAVPGSRFAAPAGLAVDAVTGAVNLPKSTVGTYDIRYTTPGGCVSVSSFTVAKPLLFPNVITPNGDGLNDKLLPNLPTATGYTLQVFSRWGRRVFEGHDPAQGWEAADNGPGLYYYRVQYTDCNGQTQAVNDWVEVLK